MLTTFGGLESIFDSIRETDPVKLQPFGTLSAFGAIAWMLAAGSLYASPQSYQRFGAAKGGLDVKISYTLMIFIGLCFSAVFVLSGMVASVHFADAVSPAEGFWAMVFTVLPIGLRGLFVAALLAAVMSTVSSDYLIVGAIVVQDIYKSFINKNLSDVKTVLASRIYILVHGLVIILATYLWHDGIGQAWFYIGGFLTAVFVVPVIMGLYYKRKTPQAGFYGLLLTMAFYIVWQFILGGAFGIPTNLAAWVFSIIVYVIIANLTYKGAGNKSDDKLADNA
jgi:Na+/proline symporter